MSLISNQVTSPDVAHAPDQASSVQELVFKGFADGVFKTAEILYARDGKIVLHKAWRRGVEDFKTGNLFDLASLTKPLAIASLMAILAERNELDLDEKVKKYIPEFWGVGKEDITLRQLTSHISGLPATVELSHKSENSSAARHYLYNLPLEYEPGTKMIYSCLGYLILTDIIVKITGKSLATLFKAEIAIPLGLQHSVFSPRKLGINVDDIVATSFEPNEIGIVHDGNSRFFGGQGGNAGLFSNAFDLNEFAQMLLNGGFANQKQILPKRFLEQMFLNQNPTGIHPRSLGWEIKQNDDFMYSCGTDFPDNSIGHTGFTGTSLWMNSMSKQVVIALTDRVLFSHEKDNLDKMIMFRKKLHNIFA